MTTSQQSNGGRGVRITNIVVGSLIGLVLMYVAFAVTGWQWGLFLTALLLYEGWALVNGYPNDTLSESVWRFAKRPMVPWLFGLGTGWGMATGFLHDPLIVLAVGFLSGHFFFQKHENGNGCGEMQTVIRVVPA